MFASSSTNHFPSKSETLLIVIISMLCFLSPRTFLCKSVWRKNLCAWHHSKFILAKIVEPFEPLLSPETPKTLPQSHCTALNGRHFPVVRAVQGDCHGDFYGGNSHWSREPTMQWRTWQSQSIFRPTNHKSAGHVSFPTDSPIATRLGLCSSLQYLIFHPIRHKSATWFCHEIDKSMQSIN